MKIFNRSTLLLVLILYHFTIFSQIQKYSRVRILTDQKGITDLANSGVTLDCGIVRNDSSVTGEFSEYELGIIKEKGFKYEILIEDMTLYYQKRNEGIGETEQKKTKDHTGKDGKYYDTPENFALGSMGGFFTYDEINTRLEELSQLFPDLVTARQQIGTGTSIEGRPLYFVKISDNPDFDDPEEPDVLIDALHHAREPAGMQQLFFYIYYLLENYETDADIKFIIDNTEIFFIPCVNPDGYLYNETIEPSGGGMWRKNRRNNGSSYGVDLNRNYSYAWGYPGTDTNPNSGSYAGTSEFSEPETQLMKKFAETHKFETGITNHTYGNMLIYPWCYTITNYQTPHHSIFIEYAQMLTAENGFEYGTPYQVLGYYCTGVSIDWMYGEQDTKNMMMSLATEAGSQSDGNWPQTNRIEDICRDFMSMNLPITLLSHQAFVNDNSPSLISDQTGDFEFTIERVSAEPKTFTVEIIPIDSYIQEIGDPVVFSSLTEFVEQTGQISYTLDPSIQNGQEFSFLLSFTDGEYVIRRTITKTYGQTVIVIDDEGNNMDNWTSAEWDVTNEDYHSPSSSITDSPGQYYGNYVTSSITLNYAIDLINSIFAGLSFWAIWNIEENYDYVQLSISTDYGNTWTSLAGNYTTTGSTYQDQGMPLYDGIQNDWVNEEINLQDYLGEIVQFRFELVTDQSVTRDGFYFDDFIIEKMDITTNNEQINNIIPHSGIYPNPVRDYAYITYTLPEGTEYSEIIILNATGQVITNKSINIDDKYIRIDMKKISEGMYYYKIIIDNSYSSSGKFVLVR